MEGDGASVSCHALVKMSCRGTPHLIGAFCGGSSVRPPRTRSARRAHRRAAQPSPLPQAAGSAGETARAPVQVCPVIGRPAPGRCVAAGVLLCATATALERRPLWSSRCGRQHAGRSARRSRARRQSVTRSRRWRRLLPRAAPAVRPGYRGDARPVAGGQSTGHVKQSVSEAAARRCLRSVDRQTRPPPSADRDLQIGPAAVHSVHSEPELICAPEGAFPWLIPLSTRHTRT